MKLSKFADYLEEIAETNSRIEKQDLVWEALQEVQTEKEEDVVLALTTCQRFEDNGVSKKTVRKVAGSVVDGGKDTIRNYESEYGDLPSAVYQASARTERIVPKKDIELHDLWDKLVEIEDASGKEMERLIQSLLSERKPEKWLTHAVLADDGVSMGFGVKSASKMLRRYHDEITKEDMAKARAICPDIIELNWLAPNVPTTPRFGEPFKPMLASSKDIPDNIDRDWMVQPKFDGARVLVHYENGEIHAFSRRCNEVTDSLPELSEVAEVLPDSGAYILDGEAVAYKDGEPQDFQYIMERFNREYDIEAQETEVQFKFFDLLYAEDDHYGDWGGDLSDVSNSERVHRMIQLFTFADAGHFNAEYRIVDSPEEARKWCNEYIDRGYEGAILKRMDATYDYDKRSHDWRKVKAEQENVDLRISEIIEGEDDRAGRMGAIRLETEDGYDLTKCGTGFTEEDQKYFWEHRDTLVGKVVEVDWFELQKSDGEYSLRFPVFQSIRDKDEADTLDRIMEIAQ